MRVGSPRLTPLTWLDGSRRRDLHHGWFDCLFRRTRAVICQTHGGLVEGKSPPAIPSHESPESIDHTAFEPLHLRYRGEHLHPVLIKRK